MKRRCLVMGIINVTPDSFSDGGMYFKPEEAMKRAMNLMRDGADIIDFGGESTRPGAEPLSWQDEWARLEDVLALIDNAQRKRPLEALVSIDTYHPETAERALKRGAGMINCVYRETATDIGRLCVKHGAALVLPAASYNEAAASGALPPPEKTYIDPMIGFGTTREQDLELLRSVPQLARRANVLVGASRKRIVKKLTGEKVTGKNVGGNLGIAIWCAMNGASAIRVHDVKETVQALKVLEALCESSS